MVSLSNLSKLKQNQIKGIKLSLATREDIKHWSNGEVKKPETINYKTFKAEKLGLFDERIFGPSTDYRCFYCGIKYKKNDEGNKCVKTPQCIENKSRILPKSSRRSRMGHIKLNAPIVHFWFLKIDHSIIAKLLSLKPISKKAKVYTKKAIEDIVYFKSHIILDQGSLQTIDKYEIINIKNAPNVYHKAFKDLLKNKYPDQKSEEHIEISECIQELEKLVDTANAQEYGIDFYEYNEILAEFGNVIIKTGAEAIETLLEDINLQKEVVKVKRKINEILKKEHDSNVTKQSQINTRGKLYKRLNIINGLIKSGQDPKNMILYNLPVIPSDLRPLIQLDGGRHSTIDVNELYRRIIIRNNRLGKWIELNAPDLIIQNEKRMLQEAVDALFDNKRKYNPIKGKDGRVLKSIADSLDGKKGRFRQNLLGKRVDYSGRSVIVVGPTLKLYQAGIPRIMAAKLFEPFIAHELLKAQLAQSTNAAKKMIEEFNPIIWPSVEKAISGKVVLLNRAPTLHRLSIQAFEPVLVRGKAIRLHPLVTTAFNADFDGDQMAVHVPISEEATLEAKELMLANKNILGVKDGEPIINPTQDMLLGLYHLTIEKKGAKGEGSFYSSIFEAKNAYQFNELSLHARIMIKLTKVNKKSLDDLESKNYTGIITTLGKLIFNEALPNDFNYIFDKSTETIENVPKKYLIKHGDDFTKKIAAMPINKALTNSEISKIIKVLYAKYSQKIVKHSLAKVIKKTNTQSVKNLIKLFMDIDDFYNVPTLHINIIKDIIIKNFTRINKQIMHKNDGVQRTLEIEEKAILLEDCWFDYNNVIAVPLDKIKELGFKYSTISGTSISAFDIPVSKIKKKVINEGNEFIEKVSKLAKEDGLITDDERYLLVKKKWEEVKEEIQIDLKKQIDDEKNIGDSIFMMMDSGARGNLSNFVQLAGLRGLMANNKVVRREEKNANVLIRNVLEVPVKSSFIEGLTGFEFFSSTHGARKGLTDIALNTANSGYLTRKLVDSSQDVVILEEDCYSDYGYHVKDIIDTKTNTIIVPLIERLIGRFLNSDIIYKKEILYKRNDLINKTIAEDIISKGIDEVSIRSVLSCHTRYGLCKKCYGIDLSNNKIVNIGEAVGIIAAQSIGEPGTQLTMRTFHTGGVAAGGGVVDVISGFPRLKELVDATKIPWGREFSKDSIISESDGIVEKIVDTKNGFEVTIKKHAYNDEKFETQTYKFNNNQKLRVKKGDHVVRTQKIVDGPIILERLLRVGGQRAVQKYLLKEIQKLYRMQGIVISDKYIEIIIKQLLSKSIVIDQGDTKLFNGIIVDVNDLHEINTKAISKGRKPAYVKQTIRGANRVSLLSNSFLAAASYQETSKILVHAAIKGKIDVLRGLKENIIVGHLIPAGTGKDNVEFKSKYDIRSNEELLK